MSTASVIAGVVNKKPKTVEQYFYRKGWSTVNPEHVREYLLKYLCGARMYCEGGEIEMVRQKEPAVVFKEKDYVGLRDGTLYGIKPENWPPEVQRAMRDKVEQQGEVRKFSEDQYCIGSQSK